MADGYTRTGNNFFSRVSRWASYSPWVLPFPFLGTTLTMGAGIVGAAVDAIGWLAQGKLFSAITAFGAGSAEAAVNSYTTVDPVLYWSNLASGIFTDGGLGRHTRKLTETVVGGVTQPLGMQPQVLASYYAGMGSIDNAASGPGYWAQRMTPEGQNAQQYYASKMNGEAMSQHAAELESARMQPNYRNV